MKDLKDLRAKITPETHVALEAKSRAFGKDRAEIVRDILHDWALQEISAADMMHGLLLAEGLRREGEKFVKLGDRCDTAQEAQDRCRQNAEEAIA